MLKINSTNDIPIVVMSMPRVGSNALGILLASENKRTYIGETFNALTPEIHKKAIEKQILSYEQKPVVLNVHTHIMDNVWQDHLDKFLCVAISRKDRLSQFVSFLINETIPPGPTPTIRNQLITAITPSTYSADEIIARYKIFCKMEHKHKKWIQYCQRHFYYEDVVNDFIPNATIITAKSPHYDQIKEHISQTISTFLVDHNNN